MRFTISGLVALGAASTASAQLTNQSAPFHLQIANSANASLNGLYLTGCHAGAAMEGFCVGGSTPSAYDNFYFNTTDTDTDTNPSDASQGYLVWNLPISGLPGTDHLSEYASLGYRPGTNVAVPLIQENNPTLFHFTDDGKLTMQDDYDDSNLQTGVYPISTGAPIVFNNWYVCWTGVGFYYYTALAWVTAGEPQDPTCQKVDVIRVAA